MRGGVTGHATSGEVEFPPPLWSVLSCALTEAPRPELVLSDFELCKQIRRFFSTLDSIRNGTVERIVVQAGIARRALFRDTNSMRG